jgi:hypothetical protein
MNRILYFLLFRITESAIDHRCKWLKIQRGIAQTFAKIRGVNAFWAKFQGRVHHFGVYCINIKKFL